MRETKPLEPVSGIFPQPLIATDRLWMDLKDRKMKGYRFERDKKLGNMNIDFYSSVLHFAILIDNMDKGGAVLDKESQYDLEQMGIGFLHFTRQQIEKNYNYVIRSIQFWIVNWERDFL
ncbi:MAG: DUF559 domain-containing protein [Chlorobi bacterium]|nr:DUF559 domain-containing protein [Chlorobiota bacterium]